MRVVFGIFLIALVSCGASPKIQAAQIARYDLDAPSVFNAVRDVVVSRAHKVKANEAQGTLKTAWQQVEQSPTSTSGTRRGTQMQFNDRYFVRFDISIVGERPWEVRVVGHASKWSTDMALPTDLRGADEPEWLEQQTNSMRVAIYERLRAYDVNAKH